jgi:hypothetical protein
MSENFAVTMTPNEWDTRNRAFTLGEREFKLAVSLVSKAGFKTNIVGGIDRRDVVPFALHLQKILEQERIQEPERQVLDALHRFLTGGSGGRGFAISRGWKRWNQV